MEPFANMQVSGRVLQGYVSAFRSFTLIATRFLVAEGFKDRDASGMVKIDPEAWYPMGPALRAYHRAGAEAGDSVLRQIGSGVAQAAQTPPGMNTVPAMVQLVNAGYHLNHRKNGRPMFDTATGTFTSGIGGFKVKQLSNAEFEVECDNPYPCALDLGIFEGGVRRFGGRALVTHLDDRPCRKKGAASCTLHVRLIGT